MKQPYVYLTLQSMMLHEGKDVLVPNPPVLDRKELINVSAYSRDGIDTVLRERE